MDLSDAILPRNWPKIPSILNLSTGQYDKDFDILKSDESWYELLLKFTKSQYTNLPIGLNINNLPVGSKIFNSEHILINNIENKNKNKI